MKTLHDRRWQPIAAALVLSMTAPSVARADTTAPTYGYVYTPPATTVTPKIVKVELNSDHLQAGGPIDLRVTTSKDVVKVVVGHGKRAGTLTQSAPGVFTSEATLPHVGGLMAVGISLHIVATDASGTAATADVPVHYK